MLIKIRRSWEMPEREATPESVWMNRRQLLRVAAAGPILAASAPALLAGCGDGGSGFAAAEEETEVPPEALNLDDPSADLYPAATNPAYELDRPLTIERRVLTYNNFYEFGSSKNIWRKAQKLPLRPWTVRIDGMVERPFDIGIDDLLRKMQLEERLYRHRCVEAWSMAVPWSGFPLRALVDLAAPLASAKYVKMVTFENSEVAGGQRANWYPWPYVEGLTIEEATHELAFLGTGLYGKPMPKQNGAPLRLVVPWKYGFKSIKSIVRFEFTDERPKSFWEDIQGSEYGFWANVNPEVPHARWSQARERVLGTDDRVDTQLYNGYAEEVASLYTGLEESERLFM